MAPCGYRTIGDTHPHRRAWADFSSDEDEEAAVYTFQPPVPPTVKTEAAEASGGETDSNSSLEVTRGGSGSDVDFSADPDRLSVEEGGHGTDVPAPLESVQVEDPQEKSLSEPKEAQHQTHEESQAEAVERLKATRERLLAQRRAKETRGLISAKEVQLEATRAKVTKLRQELADALKSRETRAQQEAEELLALEQEADAIQVAEPEGVQKPFATEELKVELQRLQAENQELLKAAQQVRSEDAGSKKQVQVLQAEVKKFKASLQEYRDLTSDMELQLARAREAKASKMEILRELQAERRKVEEEHRLLEKQVQAEKTRSQELESEKVSLQYSVKEAEEACRVWQWRLRKELCQIEKREPNSNFVQQLLHKAPGVAKAEG